MEIFLEKVDFTVSINQIVNFTVTVNVTNDKVVRGTRFLSAFGDLRSEVLKSAFRARGPGVRLRVKIQDARVTLLPWP